jgi:hypothetical protein
MAEHSPTGFAHSKPVTLQKVKIVPQSKKSTFY